MFYYWIEIWIWDFLLKFILGPLNCQGLPLDVIWAAPGPTDNGQEHWAELTPGTREANSKPHTVFPVARAEPQGSGLWGMVLSCPSIPLNLSPCHGKGEGWRKQLCCYSYKLSTLVTTTSPSLISAHTVTTGACGLVRSLWAVLAAVPVGKQGFLPLPQALTSEEGNCEHWG